MDLSEILTHLGEDRRHGFDAVVPPIVQSGNFTYPTVAAMRAVRAALDPKRIMNPRVLF